MGSPNAPGALVPLGLCTCCFYILGRPPPFSILQMSLYPVGNLATGCAACPPPHPAHLCPLALPLPFPVVSVGPETGQM